MRQSPLDFAESDETCQAACASTCTDDANTASEESNTGEYNGDDAKNQTCGSDTGGLSCCFQFLAAGNRQNQTDDSDRKACDGEISTQKAKNNTDNTEHEARNGFTLSHDRLLSENDSSKYIAAERTVGSFRQTRLWVSLSFLHGFCVG